MTTNSVVTLNLPSGLSIGDEIRIVAEGTGGVVVVPGAGQQVQNALSAVTASWNDLSTGTALITGQSWTGIASDSSGKNIVAIAGTPSDLLVTGSCTGGPPCTWTWTDQTTAGGIVGATPGTGWAWNSVASDSSGKNLVATVPSGSIWTGTCTGGAPCTWNWYEQTGGLLPAAPAWSSVASDSSGLNLVASINSGGIGDVWAGTCPSDRAACTWSALGGAGGLPSRGTAWGAVASDSSGMHLVAAIGPATAGDLYTGTCSSPHTGCTWTDQTAPAGGPGGAKWTSIASSGDGSHIAGTTNTNPIFMGSYGSSWSWTSTLDSSFGTQPVFNSIASDSSGANLVAGWANRGFWISRDYGQTWLSGTNERVAGASSNSFVAENAAGTHLFGASSNGDIYDLSADVSVTARVPGATMTLVYSGGGNFNILESKGSWTVP